MVFIYQRIFGGSWPKSPKTAIILFYRWFFRQFLFYRSFSPIYLYALSYNSKIKTLKYSSHPNPQKSPTSLWLPHKTMQIYQNGSNLKSNNNKIFNELFLTSIIIIGMKMVMGVLEKVLIYLWVFLGMV